MLQLLLALKMTIFFGRFGWILLFLIVGRFSQVNKILCSSETRVDPNAFMVVCMNKMS